MKNMIRIASLLLCLVLVFSACGSKTEDNTASSTAVNNENQSASANAYYADIQEDPSVNHPIVKFTMENGKTFSMKLYPEYAPETVENFVNLVSSGFYDGSNFHRVVDGFMAQGGMPKDGESDSATIKVEFAQNGFVQNTISHKRGVVSMARRSYPNDSATSQFFICYEDSTFLDGGYAAFGYVFEGMETVDDFLNVERAYNSSGEKATPLTPIVIAKAEVIG